MYDRSSTVAAGSCFCDNFSVYMFRSTTVTLAQIQLPRLDLRHPQLGLSLSPGQLGWTPAHYGSLFVINSIISFILHSLSLVIS